MRRFLISALLLSVVSTASTSLLGDNGTHRTYSAKTLGHGKITIGVSGRGSYDENRLADSGAIVRYVLSFDTTNGIPIDVPQDTTRISEVFDLTARVYMAMGFTDYFNLSVALPLHSDWLTGWSVEGNPDLADKSAIGVGDLEIAGKLQYPPYEHDPSYEMAFMGIITLPTGNKNKGFLPKELWYVPKDSTAGTRFYSAGLPTLALLMLNTVDFNEISRGLKLMWHLNFGIHSTASPILDNSFLLSSSIVWKPSGDIFSLFLEFSGQTRMSKFSDGFKLGDDPLYLTPGFILESENGMSLSLALDWSLATGSDFSQLRIDNEAGPQQDDILCPTCEGNGQYSGYKVRPAAPIGASATLSWSGFVIPKDKDKDGVMDHEDACPAESEDADGFQDGDGCPDEDNDEDGVVDLEDKCPVEPEDMDTFEDTDGCPEYDNDKDGLADKKDKCPTDAEDFNGYQDEDGCSDGKTDADKDGVPDYLDKCPAEVEDADGFEDNDGCADLDNDKDGLADNKDRCPRSAEVVNGFEDSDGCPDQTPVGSIIVEKEIIKRDTIVQVQVQKDTVVQVKKDTVVQTVTQVQKDTVVVEKIIQIEKKAKIVLHGVNFATGSVDLTPDSFEKLEEVANTLRKSPDIVLEIRGHTDDRGGAKANLTLSQGRAESVVRYLVAQGVPATQLRATGYGSKQPIASNKTAAGREKNRRIEMYRVQ